jgi:hypothetical protein
MFLFLSPMINVIQSKWRWKITKFIWSNGQANGAILLILSIEFQSYNNIICFRRENAYLSFVLTKFVCESLDYDAHNLHSWVRRETNKKMSLTTNATKE